MEARHHGYLGPAKGEQKTRLDDPPDGFFWILIWSSHLRPIPQKDQKRLNRYQQVNILAAPVSGGSVWQKPWAELCNSSPHSLAARLQEARSSLAMGIMMEIWHFRIFSYIFRNNRLIHSLLNVMGYHRSLNMNMNFVRFDSNWGAVAIGNGEYDDQVNPFGDKPIWWQTHMSLRIANLFTAKQWSFMSNIHT